MKAQDFSTALVAFAPLADERRSEELKSFAGIFDGGKEETVAARLKRIASGFGVSSSIRTSLMVIEAGLTATGANKQAADVKAVISKFSGPSHGSIAELVAQVKSGLASKPVDASRKKVEAPPANQTLARQLADELTRAVYDGRAFSNILERLSDAKQVSTPTLALTGNIFLGNTKVYKGRKPVIDDINRRQGEEVLDSSRSAAVKRAAGAGR
jgi:hypothetical protein